MANLTVITTTESVGREISNEGASVAELLDEIGVQLEGAPPPGAWLEDFMPVIGDEGRAFVRALAAAIDADEVRS